jgi:hypothetical protein
VCVKNVGIARREWLHRKRPGPPAVDELRRSAAPLPHQRSQACGQGGQLLRRRQRTREQRELHDAAGRGIDGNRDPIDSRVRGMRFEIEQRERPQRTRVAHRRRQLQRPFVHGACDQMQPDVQDRRAAIAPLEMRGQRLHETAKHERERLESLDRPVQLECLLEPLLGRCRHERPLVLPTRKALPLHARCSQPRGHFIRRQDSKLTERSKPPPSEREKQLVRVVRNVRNVRNVRFVRGVRDVREQRQRQGSEHLGFGTGINDRDSCAIVDEETCGRARPRNRHTHPQPAIGGGASQFVRNHPRLAEQPLEPAQIQRDLTRTTDFDPR